MSEEGVNVEGKVVVVRCEETREIEEGLKERWVKMEEKEGEKQNK